MKQGIWRGTGRLGNLAIVLAGVGLVGLFLPQHQLAGTNCSTVLLASELAKSDEQLLEALRPFDGHWKGVFRVYSVSGKLSTELQVEQRYWWEGNVQLGRFFEVAANGGIVTAEAKNFVQDGRLVCEVKKSTGEASRHVGRVEDGVLIWSREMVEEPGEENPNPAYIVESFRERVLSTPQGPTYAIDGLGVYGRPPGQTIYFFEGRYVRVKDK